MSPKEKVNAEWHASHQMPENPSREERIEWHYEHEEKCGCRPVPESLADDVRIQAKKARGSSA